MSVIHFSDQEFAGLWHQLGGAPELQYPLHCLAIANRAAYMLTFAWLHSAQTEARTLSNHIFMTPRRCLRAPDDNRRGSGDCLFH